MAIVESTKEESPPLAAPALERSKTTLNVSVNARGLTSWKESSPVSPRAPPKTAPVRSNTVSGLKQAPPFGGLVRGLSVERSAPTAKGPMCLILNRIEV